MGDRRAERLEALRASLAAEGFETLLVTSLPNIRYLTGFSGSSAVLLITSLRAVLVTDFRYEAQAPAEVGDAASVEIDRASVWDRLGRILAEDSPAMLAVESAHVTLKDEERIAELGNFEIRPAPELIEPLRERKSAEEVGAIRRAAMLAQDALAAVLPTVRV